MEISMTHFYETYCNDVIVAPPVRQLLWKRLLDDGFYRHQIGTICRQFQTMKDNLVHFRDRTIAQNRRGFSWSLIVFHEKVKGGGSGFDFRRLHQLSCWFITFFRERLDFSVLKGFNCHFLSQYTHPNYSTVDTFFWWIIMDPFTITLIDLQAIALDV